MTTDPITRAVACNLCTGCGACAGAFPEAIRMIEHPVHGRRPVVAPGPAGRAAAEAAIGLCAGAETDHTALPRRDAVDEMWGPVLAAWEGWAADPEIRYRGSSGGAVTALALFALETGAVDSVAHIAASEADPLENVAVQSTNRAGLLRGSGSRYAQASPCEALGPIAEAGRSAALIGKPCDIASAARAAAADPQLADSLALTIGIFCAGAPNRSSSETLLCQLGVPEGAQITALRYRGEGWPGTMQARWIDADGTAHDSERVSYATGWDLLQKGRQWRCRICTDHTAAFADIAVGDPWHAPPVNGAPEPGRSLILARTPRGRRLIEAAIAAGALVAEPRARDVVARAQPNLAATMGAVWGRRLAMRVAGLPVPKEKGLPLFRFWRHLPLRAQVQSVAGSLRRILSQALWRPIRMEPGHDV